MVKSAALSRMDFEGKAEDSFLGRGEAGVTESESDGVGEARMPGSADGVEISRPGVSIMPAPRIAGVVRVSRKMSEWRSATKTVSWCTSGSYTSG